MPEALLNHDGLRGVHDFAEQRLEITLTSLFLKRRSAMIKPPDWLSPSAAGFWTSSRATRWINSHIWTHLDTFCMAETLKCHCF